MTPIRHPLTAAQRSIWADEVFSAGDVLHTMADHLDIRGAVDVDLLVQALRRLGTEADVLRARLADHDGSPCWELGEADIPIDVVDLRAQHEDDALAQASTEMHADLQRPFDLESGPLSRGTIYQVADDRCVCYLAMHHLLCDGYSRVPLYARLSEIYQALAAGTEVPGPALPGFDVLVDAERRYLQSPAHEIDRKYWEQVATGVGEPFSLSDEAAVPGNAHLRRTVIMPSDQVGVARDAARRANTSWPAFVIAAVGTYLGRVAGRTTATLTVPVAARVGAQTRRVPGMVANYMPFTVDAEPGATVAQLLGDVSTGLMRTIKHQRYRGEEVRRVAGLGLDDRRPFGPYVNVLPQAPVLDLGTAQATVVNMSTGIVDDLMVTVLDGPDGSVEFHVDGNPAMYDAATLDGYATGLVAFTDALATIQPESFVAAVPVRLDPLRDAAALGTGPTAADEIGDVVEQVRTMAAQHPSAVAVIDDDGDLTYQALVRYADTVARELSGTDQRARGAVVAILAEPGRDFVAAILGILGAGAAFVPLDVRAPAVRTAGLLADCGAEVVIVDQTGARALDEARPLLDEVPRVVETADVAARPHDGTLAPLVGSADDVAYVLFTSGTTGRPKGAMVHRGGLMNHLGAKQDLLSLSAIDRVVQNAPVTFDVSIWQMLSPLLTGGGVRVVSPLTAADPDALARVVHDDAITVLEVVPSLLRAALDLWAATSPDLSGLRFLMVTGEALPADLVRRWTAEHREIPMINAYGPTECSDDVAHAVLGPTSPLGQRTPVGIPIRNTDLWVLGPDLAPLPRGAVGELYVSGVAVGHGYLADPARTSTTFVADPFGAPGARLYRTGDRVRWSAHGALEFVERLDHQVKIRGQRIELGEVEAALRAIDGIDDAVAVARTGARGLVHLDAYVVADSASGHASTNGLDHVRAAAAATLPEHMIPARWQVLDMLPLTAHGKVDRAALTPIPAAPPAGPELRSGAESGGDVGPADAPVLDVDASADVVETIQAAVADLLGVTSVGPDDAFFALGGDSISAIQLVARLRNSQVEVTPRDVFEHGTPRGLARVGTRPQPDTTDRVAGPRQLVSRRFDGSWIVEPSPIAVELARDTGSIDDSAASYAQYTIFRAPDDIEIGDVVRLLEAVVHAHPMLRLEVSDVVSGVWSHVVPAPADNLEHEVAAQVRQADLGADLTAEVQSAAARLAPARGVVWQAVLVPGKPCRLVLVVHHLVVDGVSWRVLGADLATAWNALRDGRPVDLTPEAATYAEHTAVWGATARTGEIVSEEIELWRSIPTRAATSGSDRDVNRAAPTWGAARRMSVVLDTDTTAALLSQCPAAYRVDVNDLLLGALSVCLADAGLPAAVVEVEGHGREEPPNTADYLDLSRSVGWFTTAFPVPLPETTADRPPAERLRTAAKAVHQRLRSVPGHGIGYGVIRHQHPQGDLLLGHQSTPAIGFNYLGRMDVAATPDSVWHAEPLEELIGSGLRAGTIGTVTDTDMPMRHRLAVTALAEEHPDGPRLVAEWIWSLDHDNASADDNGERSIRDLAEAWFEALRGLVAAVDDPANAIPVPADVAARGVTQDDLDAFVAMAPGTPVLDVRPLGSVQRGILFESQFRDDAVDPYVLHLAADLVGPLDIDRLRAATEALVHAHPVLGGQFHYLGDGTPVHVIRDVGSVEFLIDDPGAEGATEDERAAAAERIAVADRARWFDLTRGPMLRARLTTIGPNRHRFALTIHHIVVDGWSMPILVDELLTRYSGGTPAPRIADHEIVTPPHDDPRGVAVWRSALESIDVPTLVAPAVGTGPARQPETVWVSLDATATARLNQWARHHGVTVASALLVAWGAVLATETGEPDVVFGATVTTRPADVDGMDAAIGMFLGNVPVRVRRRPGDDASTLVRRVQAEQVALREHPQVSLSSVLAGRPLRGGSGRLYDTAVIVENFPSGDVLAGHEVAGLRVDNVEFHDARPFPLSLVVLPGSELALGVDHHPDLISGERAARIAEVLLAAIADVTNDLVPAALAPVHDDVRPDEKDLDGQGSDDVPVAPARPPADAVEATVCTVFATVLGRSDVGPDDNFFALGGDSIAAIHVVTGLRTAGVVVTAQDVFVHRTPAGLAAAVQSGAGGAESAQQPSTHATVPSLTDAELDDLDAELGF